MVRIAFPPIILKQSVNYIFFKSLAVGAPIDTVQKDDPTAEEVDKLHGYYTEALEKLFEANKSKYVKDYENVKLVIE